MAESTIRMGTGVPTFVVPDVAATAQWYGKELGFRLAGSAPSTPPYAYASLQRDGVELMLLALADYVKPDLRPRRPDGVWDAYIRMQGVQQLYEMMRDRDCINLPLTRQPYGDWEFEVRDPNGYILVFGEAES